MLTLKMNVYVNVYKKKNNKLWGMYDITIYRVVCTQGRTGKAEGAYTAASNAIG